MFSKPLWRARQSAGQGEPIHWQTHAPMKIAPSPLAALAGVALALVGCEQRTVVVRESAPPVEPVARTKTLETSVLKSRIDAYERAPSLENSADVRKAFAELDAEIAELEGHVARKTGEDRAEAAQKLANLTAYRAAETARFQRAQTAAPAVAPAGRVDDRSGLQKTEDAARRTGNALEDAAKETGAALKDAAKDAGNAIKDAVR
jgi:hypothetical protein